MFKNMKFNLKFKFKVQNIVLITVMAIATGCKTEVLQESPARPNVIATHSIICDFVKTIAQETIDLTCLIDADQDPHTYRPTPSQRKAIEEADLILYGGYELEPLIIKLLAATKTTAPKIALYEQVVKQPILEKPPEPKDEAHKTGGEVSEFGGSTRKSGVSKQQESEPDPHVWHNVKNAVAMVDLLKNLLVQTNPGASEVYLNNSKDLTAKLWQLDSWIKEQLATIPPEQKVLVTTHDSLNYYVQAYHFEEYKVLQGLSSAASPTASQVRELAAKIGQIRVPTIFAESTRSDRVIRNVANAANAELSTEKLYVDGLGDSNNYREMMSHNTCAIVNGLGGQCKPLGRLTGKD